MSRGNVGSWDTAGSMDSGKEVTPTQKYQGGIWGIYYLLLNREENAKDEIIDEEVTKKIRTWFGHDKVLLIVPATLKEEHEHVLTDLLSPSNTSLTYSILKTHLWKLMRNINVDNERIDTASTFTDAGQRRPEHVYADTALLAPVTAAGGDNTQVRAKPATQAKHTAGKKPTAAAAGGGNTQRTQAAKAEDLLKSVHENPDLLGPDREKKLAEIRDAESEAMHKSFQAYQKRDMKEFWAREAWKRNTPHMQPARPATLSRRYRIHKSQWADYIGERRKKAWYGDMRLAEEIQKTPNEGLYKDAEDAKDKMIEHDRLVESGELTEDQRDVYKMDVNAKFWGRHWWYSWDTPEYTGFPMKMDEKGLEGVAIWNRIQASGGVPIGTPVLRE